MQLLQVEVRFILDLCTHLIIQSTEKSKFGTSTQEYHGNLFYFLFWLIQLVRGIFGWILLFFCDVDASGVLFSSMCEGWYPIPDLVVFFVLLFLTSYIFRVRRCILLLPISVHYTVIFVYV